MLELFQALSCLGTDRCVVCSAATAETGASSAHAYLCETCAQDVPYVLRPLPVLPPGIASGCYLGDYAGPVGGLVRAGKYGGNEGILWALGTLCGKSLDTRRIDRVVAVPSSPFRRLVRGMNPTDLLAYPLASLQGLPLFHPLTRRRARPQARLRRHERGANARAAFRTVCPVEGRILLVDDVVTTGSTARACAEALLCAGAEEVHLLAVAATASGIVPES